MTPAIKQLDQRFKRLRPFAQGIRPAKGWVRAIRNALGMTTAQLARRLGVSQPWVVEIEQSEVSGAITLKTLRRAAEALDCGLVYLLVPRQPLEKTLRARAELIAARDLDAVAHTMRLEDQALEDKAVLERQLKERVSELLKHPARLWDENV